jgi:hypothetical protein
MGGDRHSSCGWENALLLSSVNWCASISRKQTSIVRDVDVHTSIIYLRAN